MYYFSFDPPYFLFIAALLGGLACGRAFETALREKVSLWSTQRQLLNLDELSIQMPYIGMAVTIGVFLATGLEIFGFPPDLAYPVAIVLTLGSGYFIWRQLGNMMVELVRGGSAALDLDREE